MACFRKIEKDFEAVRNDIVEQAGIVQDFWRVEVYYTTKMIRCKVKAKLLRFEEFQHGYPVG
jgi:hypothetical protein